MFKFLVDALTGNLQAHVRRRALIGGLALIAALAALAALGYALGALHVWLAARYDPMVASLGFGGAFLVIAMGFAIAGLCADGETIIQDAEWADISYPGFFKLLNELSGGCVSTEA